MNYINYPISLKKPIKLNCQFFNFDYLVYYLKRTFGFNIKLKNHFNIIIGTLRITPELQRLFDRRYITWLHFPAVQFLIFIRERTRDFALKKIKVLNDKYEPCVFFRFVHRYVVPRPAKVKAHL